MPGVDVVEVLVPVRRRELVWQHRVQEPAIGLPDIAISRVRLPGRLRGHERLLVSIQLGEGPPLAVQEIRVARVDGQPLVGQSDHLLVVPRPELVVHRGVARVGIVGIVGERPGKLHARLVVLAVPGPGAPHEDAHVDVAGMILKDALAQRPRLVALAAERQLASLLELLVDAQGLLGQAARDDRRQEQEEKEGLVVGPHRFTILSGGQVPRARVRPGMRPRPGRGWDSVFCRTTYRYPREASRFLILASSSGGYWMSLELGGR